jgi:hypothetical protein
VVELHLSFFFRYINIIRNLSTFEEDNAIINMHKELTSNTMWDKLRYVNRDLNELIKEMVAQAIQTSIINSVISWHNQHSGKLMLGFFILIGLLTVITVFLIWYNKRPTANKIIIALPNVTA